MNNARREKARQIVEELSGLIEEVNILFEEEREVADNLEEHFPGSDKAEESEAAADALEEANAEMSSAMSQLESLE